MTASRYNQLRRLISSDSLLLILIWTILDKTTLYLKIEEQMLNYKIWKKSFLWFIISVKKPYYKTTWKRFTYKSSSIFTRTALFLFLSKAFWILSFSDFGNDTHLPCLVFHSQEQGLSLKLQFKAFFSPKSSISRWIGGLFLLLPSANLSFSGKFSPISVSFLFTSLGFRMLDDALTKPFSLCLLLVPRYTIKFESSL